MTLSTSTCDYIDKIAASIRDRISLSPNTVAPEYEEAKKCVEGLRGRVEHRPGRDSGMCKTGENSFIIYVKEENIEELFHELGHVLLEWNNAQDEGDKEVAVVDDKKSDDSNNNGLSNPREEAANYFMRMVIMPTDLFMKQVIKYTYNNLCDFSELAKAFSVSRYIVIKRGKELGLWS